MESQLVLVGSTACIILAMAGMAGMYFTVNHRDTFPFQRRLFLTGLIIRFSAAVLLHEPNVYSMIVGQADASGWEIARSFKEEVDQSQLGILAIPEQLYLGYSGHNNGYPALLGVYFCLIRLDTEMSAAALSCCCGAMTALLAYRLARVLFFRIGRKKYRMARLFISIDDYLVDPDHQGTSCHPS